jgi:uncharacterized protein YunC (DUF1805 family)
MQMNLNLATREQLKRAWAFAVDKRGTSARRTRRSFADYRHCIIMSCSKEAKLLGIRAGMKYEEAKLLLPDIRILVIGDRQS